MMNRPLMHFAFAIYVGVHSISASETQLSADCSSSQLAEDSAVKGEGKPGRPWMQTSEEALQWDEDAARKGQGDEFYMGDGIEVQGVEIGGADDFNGMAGIVTGRDPGTGKYEVFLPGPVRTLRLRKLFLRPNTQLTAVHEFDWDAMYTGDEVEIRGVVSQPKLNGQRGTLEHSLTFQRATLHSIPFLRWHVLCEDGVTRNLKALNLLPAWRVVKRFDQNWMQGTFVSPAEDPAAGKIYDIIGPVPLKLAPGLIETTYQKVFFRVGVEQNGEQFRTCVDRLTVHYAASDFRTVQFVELKHSSDADPDTVFATQGEADDRAIAFEQKRLADFAKMIVIGNNVRKGMATGEFIEDGMLNGYTKVELADPHVLMKMAAQKKA